MKAIRVERPGGPEALVLQEVAVPQPGPGEARVRIHADRGQLYRHLSSDGAVPAPAPLYARVRSSGVVDAVGEGVTEVKPGDRVAYAMHRGSYAEYAVVPAGCSPPCPTR